MTTSDVSAGTGDCARAGATRKSEQRNDSAKRFIAIPCRFGSAGWTPEVTPRPPGAAGSRWRIFALARPRDSNRLGHSSLPISTAHKQTSMSGVRLLVGTKKGAFIITADGTRDDWTISQPQFGGWE